MFDQGRYNSLIARCAADFSFYKGTIQDLSGAQLAMSFAGAPTWSRVNGHPALAQRANADGAASAATGPVVDVTGAFFVEALFVPQLDPTTTDALLHQQAAGSGGFDIVWNPATDIVTLTLYTAAGAVARTISTAANTVVPTVPLHVVLASSAGGAAGTAWLRGIPAAVALAGAGVAANTAAAPVGYGRGTGLSDFIVSRVFSGAPGNEDAACLAEVAREMVGGW